MRIGRRLRPPFSRVVSPLRDFLATEAAGAALLAGAAALAVVWANSRWSASYEKLWATRASLTFAGHTLGLDLRHWVNDGLMAIFFFVVGLEIKRELTDGHLSDRRAALLPAAAAVGGMIAPVLIYLAVAGTTAPRGWAIPMATDIALSVGVLAVAGDRIPTSLRAFLLALAIVDDLGAILIIAVVYSTGIGYGGLAAAGAGLVVALSVRRAGVQSTWVYVVIGSVVWVGLHEAGIHPTMAGVAMGLLAPSTPLLKRELVDIDELTDISDVDAARVTSQLARGSVSVVEWLQHVLHPWTSFVIVPVFALANSGISISVGSLRDAAGSAITWGVLLGLVLGKPLGIIFATRATIRAKLASSPEGTIPRQIVGIGTVAGVGFTVAIFITELALTDAQEQSHAKVAILFASVIAAVSSIVLLIGAQPRPITACSRQSDASSEAPAV